jgi:type II secretory pathway component GspD/PulD (secretin)
MTKRESHSLMDDATAGPCVGAVGGERLAAEPGRWARRRFLASLLLLLVAMPARAELEILTLRHRTVDQVLPALQPFVEPGGAIQGMSGQIIVRASPQNIAELRRLLESIDTPARRLLISVTQDAATATRAAAVGVGVRGRGNEVELAVAAGDRRSRGTENIAQQVQALEGSPATISVGTAVPTAVTTWGPNGVLTNTGGFAQFNTGFSVTPRLAGERVFLDIAPQRASVQAGGSASVQRVATSVSGRVGEWIPLGGISTERSAQGASIGGITGRSAGTEATTGGVWVRVEVLP